MKSKSSFKCTNCGYMSAKWVGKCSNCNEWETLKEFTQDTKTLKLQSTKANVTKLKDIEDGDFKRSTTGISEFDRTLGGGIVPGSLVLIGGDPGIGKSTLMLQMCSHLISLKPIYVTGEESAAQIKNRAERISGVSGELQISAENSLDSIELLLKSDQCGFMIIDSIQSIHLEGISSPAGSMLQVRECTYRLMELAKKLNKSVFIIGHITKDGAIAGPKSLEHLVDTVLQFEGDNSLHYRIIRTIKNRFGAVNEIGIFEMSSKGLIEVKDPSGIFISGNKSEEPGIATSAIMEGTRPISVEIQSLVAETGFSMPQRISTGYDQKRLQILLSILDKRIGIKFFKSDVFLNVAGGIHINDPAVDLAVIAALVSSERNSTINPKTIIFGELSLTGEVRPVSFIEARLKEAEKTGFTKAIIPDQAIDIKSKMNIIKVSRLSLALNNFFN
ncbi:DNA repair protein RadA [Candidatus Kapabacteria bacterium]|nr:DNA repair protein RadA [Candidatus Kapabacteria bacterium]